MIVYNGIICCERDNELVPRHIAQLDSLGQPMQHCLYYGMDSKPRDDVPHHTVGLFETYENFSCKVYSAFKHALQFPEWDVFVKSDVTSKVVEIRWDLVAVNDLVGWVTPICGPYGNCQFNRAYALERYTERAFAEPFTGKPPKYWIGGPCYVISRKLAKLAVDRGIWAWRGWQAEDVYIAKIAEDHGISPVNGVLCE